MLTSTPNLHLEVIRHNALADANLRVIIDLCTLAFEEPMEAYVRQNRGGAHVLARLGGKLVGHASYVPRQLQPEGLPILHTAYVEDVAIHPDFQGLGIGTKVMQRMATEIADFELGGLAGEAAFYARLGWEVWRGKTAARTEQGLVFSPEEEGLMILRLARTPPLNLDALITCEWRPLEVW